MFLYLSILATAYRGITRVAKEFRALQISLVAGLVALFYEQVWDIFDSRQQGYLFWLVVSLAVILPRIFPAQAPAPAAGVA